MWLVVAICVLAFIFMAVGYYVDWRSQEKRLKGKK